MLIFCAGVADAMTVYMMDESEIEAYSAWQVGERVYVRVNPDLCLDFPSSAVDVRKSGISVPRANSPMVDGQTRAASSAMSGDVLDELVMVAGHRRDINDLFGRNTHSEIDQLLSGTFSPALAEKSFKRCLARRLTNRELAAVLAWYKSPVGMKIVEADSVLDFNRTEKTLTYVTMESAPGYKERMYLIGQIEKMTGASEIEIKLTRSIIHNMIIAIPDDFQDAKEIKKRLQEEIPTLKSKRQENIDKWAYSYRGLTIVELRDYLKFLRSATGSKYVAAVREATEEIFRKVAMNIEKDFRKEVRMFMK
jgi:hypothetical protein